MFDSAQTMHQTISAQENGDRPSFIPAGLQDLEDYLI